MIDGCRRDDGVDAAGERSDGAPGSPSAAAGRGGGGGGGLSVDASRAETVERPATRGPKSDRLRSIGRDGRPRRRDCELAAPGWIGVEDSRSPRGSAGACASRREDEVDGAASSPGAAPVCRSALYISINTSSFASMSST